EAQSTLETGAVSDSKELFWIRAASWAALLFWSAEADIDHLVVGGTTAISTTRNFCLGSVCNVFGSVHISSPLCRSSASLHSVAASATNHLLALPYFGVLSRPHTAPG